MRITRHSTNGWQLQLSGHLTAGSVTAWPSSTVHLRRKIRLVAATGPTATAALCGVALFMAAAGGHVQWASAAGITAAVGLVLLVSALVPGALHPSARDGGTDGDQLRFSRRIEAFWVHAALLEGLRTKPAPGLGAVVPESTLRPLLPPLEAPAEPIESSWAVTACESGTFDVVRARLDARLTQSPSGPDWLWGDLCLIRALVAALVDNQPEKATALRPLVLAHQGFDWFVCLLDAALAEDQRERHRHLGHWRAGVEQSEAQPFALPAAAWALARISP
jgi:hypothetical protein